DGVSLPRRAFGVALDKDGRAWENPSHMSWGNCWGRKWGGPVCLSGLLFGAAGPGCSLEPRSVEPGQSPDASDPTRDEDDTAMDPSVGDDDTLADGDTLADDDTPADGDTGELPPPPITTEQDGNIVVDPIGDAGGDNRFPGPMPID